MTGFRSQRGQAAVLSVVFMTVLLGMSGLVLDVGSWYRADRAAQATADAAALAAAQALPDDPDQAVALALEYAGKNGAEITADDVEFPAADTVKVTVTQPAQAFFARLFDIDSVNAHATASARATGVSGAKWVAPIVVNEKHPLLTCQPEPCFGDATELEYHHLKGTAGDTESDGAGSFGFINLKNDGSNPGTSELGAWIRQGYDDYLGIGDYQARTGNPFSSTHVEENLDDRIGTELLFPIYRKLTGSGSNAKYEIVGWVGFHLTGHDLKGNKETLFGHFTKVIWEALPATSGSTGLGVKTIKLVE